MTEEALREYDDFTSPAHVSYSARPLYGRNPMEMNNPDENVIGADQNPLFAEFRFEGKVLDLADIPDLLQVNSPNHGGRGQCVGRQRLELRRAGVYRHR